MLNVRTGEFRAQVPFLNTTNLPIDCLLRTLLIDNSVQAITPGYQKFLIYHAGFVPIISSSQSSKGKTTFPQLADSRSEDRSWKVRQAWPVSLPAMSKFLFRVQCPTSELSSIVNNPNTAARKILTL